MQSNLEVLWLNNNKLVSVTNLDANFRIKEFYLHVSLSGQRGVLCGTPAPGARAKKKREKNEAGNSHTY